MEKLTTKEEEVMEMIWTLGPCAPKEVLELYADPKPNINTVANSFQALERKGYLTHVAKGRGFIYAPIIKKNEYGRSKFSSFVSRYFGNSYMNVVSALVKDEMITKSELRQLLEELKK